MLQYFRLPFKNQNNVKNVSPCKETVREVSLQVRLSPWLKVREDIIYAFTDLHVANEKQKLIKLMDSY